jgi:hypothetical protein
MRLMTLRQLFAALAVGMLLTACASNPARPVRSEFEDIPVPKGLTYQADESTIIETTSVKAVRQVYRGRLELESLATAIRTTLEANGWRHVSSTPMRTSQQATTQVYEKDGDSLKVQLWEGLWKWYTYAEYTTGRVLKRVK